MIPDRRAPRVSRARPPTAPTPMSAIEHRTRARRAARGAALRVRPVVLLILDGFGSREPRRTTRSARRDARLEPAARHLAAHDDRRLRADVGLPAGQMGNSEVGHLNIGAGRVIYQDFTRIDQAIATGEFARNPCSATRWPRRRRSGSALHVLGLLSPGGVHSHERQIAALVAMAAAAGVKRILVHAFLDGRDTPPRSAAHRWRSWRRVREARRRAHRVDRRSLLRDGPRPALGPRRARPTICWSTAARPIPPRPRGPASTPPTRAAKTTSSSSRRRSWQRRPAARDGRRRRGRVHEFPRRPRAADDARAHRPGVRRLCPRRVPKLARVRCLTATARNSRTCRSPLRRSDPQRLRRIHSGLGLRAAAHRRDREVRARHVLLQRRRRGGLSGRGPHSGASPKVATYDLKPEMSAPEVTDKLVAAIEPESTMPSSATTPTATWSATPAISRPRRGRSRRWTPASAA